MMYINEAIRQADALSPNEYSLKEKYAWIDELNATLMQEHLKKYASAPLEPQEDGTYLLPEGITFEMVDKIIAQGRSIEKYDFRSFGIEPMYTPRERFYMPVHCQANGAIRVIYLAQHQPIRAPKDENITVTFAMHSTDMIYPEGIESLGIKLNVSNSYAAGDTVYIESGEVTFKEIIIKSAEVQDDGTVLLQLDISKEDAEMLFDSQQGTNFKEVPPYHAYDKWYYKDVDINLERIVTDQTLIPAPYDQIYIDWIMAKVAFYQRNYTVYNQIMNKFYETLQRFDSWYIQRAPMDKDNKIRNWTR